MIMDHELTQLSHSEVGFIGSLGFVGLGAAFGLVPQLVETFGKVEHVPPTPVTLGDIGCVGAFVGAVVLTIVCLAIAGIYKHRNRSLAQAIRNRGKQGFPPIEVKAG
jgi:hypothetical protein